MIVVWVLVAAGVVLLAGLGLNVARHLRPLTDRRGAAARDLADLTGRADALRAALRARRGGRRDREQGPDRVESTTT